LIYGGETVKLELISIKTKIHLQEKADLTNTLYDNHVYTVEQSLHEASQCNTSENQSESTLEVVNANSPASFLDQLVYVDARAVAYIECSEFKPNHFWLDILVHPDFQRQGIGSRLMLEGLAHVQKYSGTHVEAQIRSDWTAHNNFYAKHGFERSTAWVKWWLKPRDFAHQSTVQVKSLAELEQPIDENVLLELMNELRFAANQSEPSKTYTLEMLKRDVFGAMWFKPEHFWVVFDQQNLVAASWVAGFKNDPTLFLEFLGVRASARSKGIGSAFVAKMVEVCQQNDFQGIEAHAHPDETVTNGFLEHRGFEHRPGYLLVKKTLSKETRQI
jgi:ribosomal protein S18 acetylase RimI-like enzyme